MGKLSEVMASHRFPLEIDVFPCLHDHCFQGRAVYPAVEAMQVLADSTPSFLSEMMDELPADVSSLIQTIRTDCIENARFDKFLVVPPDAERIFAFNEIEVQADGSVCVSLLTRFQSKNGKITRMIKHAALCFNSGSRSHALRGKAYGCANINGCSVMESRMHSHAGAWEREEPGIGEPSPSEPPKDAFIIPADRLYKELVPFAPAYRNIVDHAWLTPTEAGAVVSAAEYETGPGPLGSPFPLDAAFHVACAWSQRFAGIVAFPVGLEQRRVFAPTQMGETYRASVIPRMPVDNVSNVSDQSAVLLFDIELFSMDGTLCERVAGVRMRDVSGGRVRPEGWVLEKNIAGDL